jgi:hypothetical protein
MPRTISSGLKLAAAVSACFAAIFVVFGGFSLGYTLPNIALLSISGAVFGAIGAPHIEPKAFRYPTLWQMFFSVVGCILVAVFLQASFEGYALAFVVGCIAGYLAPYWVPHIQAP